MCTDRRRFAIGAAVLTAAAVVSTPVYVPRRLAEPRKSVVHDTVQAAIPVTMSLS